LLESELKQSLIRLNPEITKNQDLAGEVNYKDNLTESIKYAKPERWKVLQVLPIVGQNDTNIDEFKITTSQFNHFLETHQQVKNNMIPESNTAIKGSYVMVDPAGRFFDNAQGTHNYSKPILEIGVAEAIKAMDYDLDKFLKRGGKYKWGREERSLITKEVCYA
jgi:radical S-adenosyl methionine domain-containing protein 2